MRPYSFVDPSAKVVSYICTHRKMHVIISFVHICISAACGTGTWMPKAAEASGEAPTPLPGELAASPAVLPAGLASSLPSPASLTLPHRRGSVQHYRLFPISGLCTISPPFPFIFHQDPAQSPSVGKVTDALDPGSCKDFAPSWMCSISRASLISHFLPGRFLQHRNLLWYLPYEGARGHSILSPSSFPAHAPQRPLHNCLQSSLPFPPPAHSRRPFLAPFLLPWSCSCHNHQRTLCCRISNIPH